MLILRIGLDISGRTCCCEGDGEGDEEGDGDGEGEEEEEASVRIDSVVSILFWRRCSQSTVAHRRCVLILGNPLSPVPLVGPIFSDIR